jgi:hypothetical protein
MTAINIEVPCTKSKSKRLSISYRLASDEFSEFNRTGRHGVKPT